MIAGGVPTRTVDHAQRVVMFGLEMLEMLRLFNKETNQNLNIRVGINTGPVIAGVIGTRKIAYDLWGGIIH